MAEEVFQETPAQSTYQGAEPAIRHAASHILLRLLITGIFSGPTSATVRWCDNKCFNTSSIMLFLYLFFPKIKTWLIVWCPLEDLVRIKSKHELTDIENFKIVVVHTFVPT